MKLDHKLPDTLEELEHSLGAMFTMQDEFNSKLSRAWWDAGFEFYDAGWVECAELLDHYGWKWWNKQEPNINQVKLELIDIWHFLMSDLMVEYFTEDFKGRVDRKLKQINWVVACVASRIWHDRTEKGLRASINPKQIHVRGRIRQLASAFANRNNNEALYTFVDLAMHFMDWEELHVRYVGKNVLNSFRQDQGYKQGHYNKVWSDGREDNEHMMEIAAKMVNKFSIEYRSELYSQLTTAWNRSEQLRSGL